MKKYLLPLLLPLFLPSAAVAQESSSAYNALKLPVSPHAAALGGDNITLTDDEAGLGIHNPALLANISDNTLALNYMNYFGDTHFIGAQYVRAFGARHTANVFVQMLTYGSMDETDENGALLGTFSAKDIVFGFGYSYLMSDRLAGGATLKGIASSYAEYSSFAVAIDLGLNFYVEETDLSLSLAMKNIGAQVSSFYGDASEHPPFTMQFGYSQTIRDTPLRISLTLTDLTRWRKSYYYLDEESEEMSGGRMLLNHIIAGLEFLPTDRIFLAVGYNFRRAYEMKAAGSSKWAGLSLGGGITTARFQAAVSWAKYRVGSSAIQGSVSYAF